MLFTNAVLCSLTLASVSFASTGQDSGFIIKRHSSHAAYLKRGVAASNNNTRKSCNAKVPVNIKGRVSINLSASVSVGAAPTSSTSQPAPSKTPSSGGGGSGNSGNSGSGGGGGQVIKTPGTYTPNGIKAGIAGGDSYQWMQPYIGSWYDWSPNPQKSGKPYGIPMLWGGGGSGSQDSSRLEAFKHIDTPKYVLGFEEPDCAAGGGSSGMSVSQGVQLWNQYIGPLKAKGSVLASPSMCHQAAEKGWLGPFQQQIDVDWDITNIHINKINKAGVLADIEHYWNTYNKPIWVSEFACVDDQNGFTPCTDQGQINDYINMIVPLFEADSRIMAYHYSDGEGLGNVWPSTQNGQLSASGQTYLNAIKKYA